MKVPPSNPPPEKAPSYDKDRTATRRSVAGAAGGLKGVDYEDDSHIARGDPSQQPSSASGAKRGEAEANVRGSALPSGAPPIEPGGPQELDASRLVLADAEAGTRAKKRRPPRRVGRDRLSVDKDAPERRPKRRHLEEEEAAEEQVIELYADALEGGAPAVSRAHLFSADDVAEPGDLSITDPDEIQRRYDSPVAYAKHCMILAEAFRRSTGATRDEAISYLGRMFVATRDRGFGRRALKEFGPSSGIVDLYPLEIIEHVLETYPGFLPKFGFGRFFQRTEHERLETDTATALILEYPAELKIRGFALKGGGCPGYTFEPADEPGRYRLQIDSPGRFIFLVSCITRTGHTLIERLEVDVRAIAGEAPAPSDAALYPPRDRKKVAAWPMPPVPALDPFEAMDVERERAERSGVTPRSGALASRRSGAREAIDLEVDESDAPIARVLSPAREIEAPPPSAASSARSPESPSRAPRSRAATLEAPRPPPDPPSDSAQIGQRIAKSISSPGEPLVARPSLSGREPAPPLEPDTAPLSLAGFREERAAGFAEPPTEEHTQPIAVPQPRRVRVAELEEEPTLAEGPEKPG